MRTGFIWLGTEASGGLNELSGSIKGGEYLNGLRDYYLSMSQPNRVGKKQSHRSVSHLNFDLYVTER
jgi:hypothetical protein